MIELMQMNNMDERQRTLFMTEMASKRKEVTAGVLFALFLGPYGAHRFYLGQKQLGFAYLGYTLLSFICFFFLIGIPMVILIQVVCLIETFMMPGRVRAYNDLQAALIAEQVRAITAAPPTVAALVQADTPEAQLAPSPAVSSDLAPGVIAP